MSRVAAFWKLATRGDPVRRSKGALVALLVALGAAFFVLSLFRSEVGRSPAFDITAWDLARGETYAIRVTNLNVLDDARTRIALKRGRAMWAARILAALLFAGLVVAFFRPTSPSLVLAGLQCCVVGWLCREVNLGRTGVSRAAAELGVSDQLGEHTVTLPWIGWGTLVIGSILALTLAFMKATLVKDRLGALRRTF